MLLFNTVLPGHSLLFRLPVGTQRNVTTLGRRSAAEMTGCGCGPGWPWRQQAVVLAE